MRAGWRRSAKAEAAGAAAPAVVGESAEAALVRAAQADRRAFAPLYLRFRDPVIAYCLVRLGDREEAEDAASAVFLNALRALPAFRDRTGSFRTWLFRIAHNEVADRHRRRGRRPEAPLADVGNVVHPGRSPEEEAIGAEACRRLRALLADLSPRERAVLELRAADLDTGEIAGVLGISEQNVRTAQSRAIHRLRGLMRVGPAVTAAGAADG